MMSDSTILILLALVAAGMLAMVVYIVRGRAAQKRGDAPYAWQPEQDYDVVLEGEGPLTPGFPVLKKREKKLPDQEKSGEPK